MNKYTIQNVICLHASTSTSRQWQPLQVLLRDSYHVIAPDLYGYGAGPKPTPAYSIYDEVTLVLSQLAPNEPFHLVGHSFGGMVALYVARHAPERVLSLTLYEPAFFAYLATVNLDAYLEVRQVRDETYWLIDQNKVVEAAALFVAYWSGEQVWRQMSAWQQQTVVDGMSKVRLEWEGSFGGGLTSAEITALHMPTLLLSGADSTAAGQASATYLHRQMPNSQRTELAQCDHMAPITNTTAVNRHIANFLQTHSTQANQNNLYVPA